MLLLVAWLFVETQRAVNREMRLYGKVQHTLRSERCTYAIISFFFALSYIGRFYLDVFVACGEPTFAAEMDCTVVWAFEGASMGVLMLFHMVNFKTGTLLSIGQLEPPYATVRLGEYHRFDTSEVDNQK